MQLVRSVSFTDAKMKQSPLIFDGKPQPYQLTEEEIALTMKLKVRECARVTIAQEEMCDHLFANCSNKIGRNAVADMYAHIAYENKEFSNNY